MDALKLLFTSDVGLMSLGVMALTIAMGFWFSAWFSCEIADSEQQRKR